MAPASLLAGAISYSMLIFTNRILRDHLVLIGIIRSSAMMIHSHDL